MKNRLYSILVAVVVLLVACGGTTTDTVGGASSCSGAARVPLGNTQYSLVANRNTSSVSVYAIDSNSGVLSEISGSPFPVSGENSEPLGVTVNPAGTLAFVPNWGNGAVSVFRIDASNGALAEVAGSPFRSADGTTSAWQVLISSSGKFAYVLNNSTDSIGVFAVNNCTGRMTEISGSPFRIGVAMNSQEMAMSANGERLYVVDANTGTLYGYRVNTDSGALTEVPGNPYVISGGYTDPLMQPGHQYVSPSPAHIAINPAGTYLYTVNISTRSVSGYAINPLTGALTEVLNSPFTVSTGRYLQQVVFNRTGSGLYVLDANAMAVHGYLVDATTGSLSPMGGTPFAVTGSPLGAMVDLTGSYLFMTTGNSENTLLAYSIDPSDGSLNAVVGSPYAANARYPWHLTVAKP